ncbi:MAG: hypothetical protein V1802_01415 [Candidatus Aenigmatarchaeota archaeon]
MEGLIEITPDKERAKSLLGTVAMRLDAIKLLYKTDSKKFASKIIEEYYESILELITALLSLDGFKTRGDMTGSHIIVIDYLRENYSELKEHEIQLVDDLRKKRIGIKYYGRHVNIDYLISNETSIKDIINKLKLLVDKKII